MHKAFVRWHVFRDPNTNRVMFLFVFECRYVGRCCFVIKDIIARKRAKYVSALILPILSVTVVLVGTDFSGLLSSVWWAMLPHRFSVYNRFKICGNEWVIFLFNVLIIWLIDNECQYFQCVAIVKTRVVRIVETKFCNLPSSYSP